jgi:hypothetical protein
MNSRHIQSYVPTKSESQKRELYISYTKGWRDGASTRFMDVTFTEHATRPDLKAAYEDGFTDGQRARKSASQGAARVYKYKPTILRAQGEPDESE